MIKQKAPRFDIICESSKNIKLKKLKQVLRWLCTVVGLCLNSSLGDYLLTIMAL